jgi:GntR family transcriptional regulator, transcriptional repressor for pyruvate dehydrogenase complex
MLTVSASILKTKKVSAAVLEEIRRMIINGEIREGDKFPSQNEFAAQLGVSRPSLREAFQVLNQLGAIAQRPRAGTILVSRTLALFSTDLDLPAGFDSEASLELMAARRIVEIGLVNMAARRADDEEINKLGQALESMDRIHKKPDQKAFSDNDLVFHHLVAMASHNRFAIFLFHSLCQAFYRLLDESFQVMPERLEVSSRGHQAIFQAIAAHDPIRARQAMNQHIHDDEKALIAYSRTQTNPKSYKKEG